MAESTDDRRALYLRWRPTAFADVVGQEHVVRTLRNAVQAGAPAHAYLFSGPRGTGKTSVARILYRAVNCERPSGGDPCGACDPCRTALAGRAMDLVEIDAASNRGIDDIRDLRDKVAFSPSDVRFRVYIVDEAHELTGPAWDAFLKTLEEPPPHAIFVLATTEAHKIPGTIVSRCQRFDFRRIGAAAISARLVEIAAEEGLTLEPDAADRLARMARGGLRDAISLLDQAAAFTAGRVDLAALREALGLADLRVVQELVEAIGARDAPATLAVMAALVDSGADLRLFAEEVGRLLRGILWATVGGERALSSEYSPEEAAWVAGRAARWDEVSLAGLIRTVADGLARIRDSAQFQLHLELAALDACSRGRSERVRSESVTATPTVAEETASVRAREARPTGRHVASGPATTSSAPSQPPSEGHGQEPAPVAQDGSPGLDLERPTLDREHDNPRAAHSAPASGVTLEVVRAHWPRVMEWVGNRNLFVHTYLQPAELAGFADGWLTIRFSFKVHFERVNESKNRGLLEQACGTIIGQPVKVRCEYAPPSKAADAELDLEDPVLRFAIDKFGGDAELVGR